MKKILLGLLIPMSAFAVDCQPAHWISSDTVDGVYQSTRSVECKLDGVPNLYVRLQDKLTNSKALGKDQFEVIETVDDLKLTENVTLSMTSEGNVTYKVSAVDIQGSDLLKKLELIVETKGNSLTFGNTVHVKRPWYALEPVFSAVAKQKAEDKFEDARKAFFNSMLVTPYPTQKN